MSTSRTDVVPDVHTNNLLLNAKYRLFPRLRKGTWFCLMNFHFLIQPTFELFSLSARASVLVLSKKYQSINNNYLHRGGCVRRILEQVICTKSFRSTQPFTLQVRSIEYKLWLGIRWERHLRWGNR